MINTKDKVYLYRCPEYSVSKLHSLIGGMFDESGLDFSGSRVLLKPNLLAPNRADQATTTHPAVVEAVIRLVKDGGGKPALGDVPAWGSTYKVAAQCGIAEVCKKYRVPVFSFSGYKKVPVLKAGRFASLRMTGQLEEFPVILNLAKFKVHSQLGLTLALKNMFGCVLYPQRFLAHFLPINLETFSRMLVGVYLATKPTFSILDGILAMEKNGPRGGDPRNLGVLLGGANPVAVDRVAGEVVKMPFDLISTLVAAREMKVQGWDLSEIEVIGDSLEELQVDDFKFPRRAPINFTLYRSFKMFVRMFIYPGDHFRNKY